MISRWLSCGGRTRSSVAPEAGFPREEAGPSRRWTPGSASSGIRRSTSSSPRAPLPSDLRTRSAFRRARLSGLRAGCSRSRLENGVQPLANRVSRGTVPLRRGTVNVSKQIRRAFHDPRSGILPLPELEGVHQHRVPRACRRSGSRNVNTAATRSRNACCRGLCVALVDLMSTPSSSPSGLHA